MNTPLTRREFLAEVGRGMLVTTVGFELASGLGLSPALAAEVPEVALDRGARGGDFLNWQPLPCDWQFDRVKKLTGAETLLKDLDEAIRGNLQARASGLVHRYGELGYDPR